MIKEDESSRPRTVAVVGLGLLGRGIATCFLGHGFRVIGCERDAAARETALLYIDRGLREMVSHAGIDSQLITKWSDRYHSTSDYVDWPTCDFVVESIDEDLTAKHAAFERIEQIVGPSVPIGSNTSAIPITELQAGRRHPERFFGMHWFEPAYATRFLEIIPGEHTSRETLAVAAEIARQCGKEPSTLAKDIPGFIVNRLGYALYREALHILELGIADVETIDRSFRNAIGVWSTIFGPFEWIDLTGGPPLYGKAMERVLPTLSTSAELPGPMARLAEESRAGSASGVRGFYENSADNLRRNDELFHAHAWRAYALMNEYFPMEDT
jgi:3-hydroxybutyryl-CoA dehydrogenase